jgi:8-oxo-dGTP pyrophosphatase MutT (NUDIX family)
MFGELRRRGSFNRLMHFYWRFSRGLTLGVRALVLDAEGRVFLIKHTYTGGWQLPGGGVEAGETLLEALARELCEEGNIEMTGPPQLHGVFFPLDALPHDTTSGTRARIAEALDGKPLTERW